MSASDTGLPDAKGATLPNELVRRLVRNIAIIRKSDSATLGTMTLPDRRRPILFFQASTDPAVVLADIRDEASAEMACDFLFELLKGDKGMGNARLVALKKEVSHD